jgi:hypothetical protein
MVWLRVRNSGTIPVPVEPVTEIPWVNPHLCYSLLPTRPFAYLIMFFLPLFDCIKPFLLPLFVPYLSQLLCLMPFCHLHCSSFPPFLPNFLLSCCCLRHSVSNELSPFILFLLLLLCCQLRVKSFTVQPLQHHFYLHMQGLSFIEFGMGLGNP